MPISIDFEPGCVPVVVKLVEAMAEATAEPMDDPALLAESVDPIALEALVRGDNSVTLIRFEYLGMTVDVDPDGHIEVTRCECR